MDHVRLIGLAFREMSGMGRAFAGGSGCLLLPMERLRHWTSFRGHLFNDWEASDSRPGACLREASGGHHLNAGAKPCKVKFADTGGPRSA